MRTRNTSVGIVGLGSAVPVDNVVGNLAIAELPCVTKTADEIELSTGIRTRHIAPDGMKTSDLAVIACERALEDARISAKDIDCLLVGTNTPDFPVPSLASVLHGRLGIQKSCSTTDLRTGCAGFTAAIDMAEALIARKRVKKALVVGADLLNRISRNSDLAMLAGDGAGAAVLTNVPDEYGLQAFISGTDGTQVDKLIIPAGGTAKALTAEGIANDEDMLHMDGKPIYFLGVETIEFCVRYLAEQLGKDLSQIDWVVSHQANWKMIARAARNLGMDESRYANCIVHDGNTSTASVPLTMDRYVESRQIRKGQIVIQIGFGAGFSYYANISRWAYTRRAA